MDFRPTPSDDGLPLLPSASADAIPPAAMPAAAQHAAALTQLLHHPGIWRRGTTPADAVPAGMSTGRAELDALLPGRGWPRGALTEILVDADGLGEVGLIVPALAALTRAGRRVVLVAPPYRPYPPALATAGCDLNRILCLDAGAERGWSAEQCLRSGCCGAVVQWLPDAGYRQLRRLQLAAASGDTVAFVFRPARVAGEASPAPLRLRVHASETGSCVDILKCRGTFGSAYGEGLRLRA